MDSLPRPRKNASLQVSIYEFIERSGGGVGPKEIAEGIGSLAKTVRSTLTVMKNKGLVHTSDHGSYEIGPDPTENTSRDIPPETIGKLPYITTILKDEPVNAQATSFNADTDIFEDVYRLLAALYPDDEEFAMQIELAGGMLEVPLPMMVREIGGTFKEITVIIQVRDTGRRPSIKKEAPPANGE